MTAGSAPDSPGKIGLAWIHQEFEIDRGYGDLYRYALESSPYRNLPTPTPLGDTGYDVVPCLAPGTVAHALALALDGAGRSRIPALDDDELRHLLDLVLSPTLDAVIKGAFKTDYAVIFAGSDTSRPGAEADPAANASYRWHCDAGPKMHLKVLVYLDEADSHDGATTVADRLTTDRFKEAGYVFGPVPDRVGDLNGLAQTLGLGDVVIERLAPPAGHGILFEPVNVLHRGVAPTFGQRRILTLGFVPFPTGWRQCFQQFAHGIRENAGFAFPIMRKA